MGTTFVSKKVVPERVGWTYRVTLTKEDGGPIPLAAWSSLTARIYLDNEAKPDIVGSPGRDILNANGGVVTDGLLVLTFLPSDSAILDQMSFINPTPRARIPGERHICELEGVYTTSRQFARKVIWMVENFAKRS